MKDSPRARAVRFVLLLGVVSLFADMTYEAGRSINGPYLALLGAGGLAVGIVAGGGELMGYLVRFFSGRSADLRGAYWGTMIAGYIVNLFSVPALALAGNWPAAAALMILERIGKGLRNPPRDVVLSIAGSVVGQGRVFGIHEAMDQVGATAGPLIAAVVLAQQGSYRHAYGLLAIPAVIATGTLVLGRATFPRPELFETGGKADTRPDGRRSRFSSVFYIYMAGMMLVAAGFADFPLIAFHLRKADKISADMIPVLYAAAMAVDALSALLFGALFDRIGASTLVMGVAAALFFAPLVFAFGKARALPAAFIGMALWGIGMGAHESVMGAIVAKIVPLRSRGRAYGLFNASYGAAWFAGSALLGWLNGVSVAAMIVFSVAAQAASLPFLIAVAGQTARTRSS